jgi:hypothetical protein
MRPLWRENGSVIYCTIVQLYNHTWAEVPQNSTAISYCLIWDSPNLEGQVPVFISPRNKVAQLYPPGHLATLGWLPLYGLGTDCMENTCRGPGHSDGSLVDKGATRQWTMSSHVPILLPHNISLPFMFQAFHILPKHCPILFILGLCILFVYNWGHYECIHSDPNSLICPLAPPISVFPILYF